MAMIRWLRMEFRSDERKTYITHRAEISNSIPNDTGRKFCVMRIQSHPEVLVRARHNHERGKG